MLFVFLFALVGFGFKATAVSNVIVFTAASSLIAVLWLTT